MVLHQRTDLGKAHLIDGLIDECNGVGIAHGDKGQFEVSAVYM